MDKIEVIVLKKLSYCLLIIFGYILDELMFK